MLNFYPPSLEVAVMCAVTRGGVQTTTGQNLDLIRRESGMNPMTCSALKIRNILGGQLSAVPDNDQWRLRYLCRLLEARGQAHYEGGETEELTSLIDSLCTT